MSSLFNTVVGFVNRNRTKLLVATVVAVGAAAYIHYTWDQGTNSATELTDEEIEIENGRRSVRLLSSESQLTKSARRTRLLLRVRRQFEVAASQFLPTLRVKIIEVVDINAVVRHIKELRTRATENKDELEIMLWNEIKNSSFSMLIVSAYMISAVCTLLQIQLHILARSLFQSQIDSDSESNTEAQLNGAKFRALIEGTYKQLFGPGLTAFAEKVKRSVALHFSDWTVKGKLNVEYDELVLALSSLRVKIESDKSELIKTIFLRKATYPSVFFMFHHY
jgi:hypothetical protein